MAQRASSKTTRPPSSRPGGSAAGSSLKPSAKEDRLRHGAARHPNVFTGGPDPACHLEKALQAAFVQARSIDLAVSFLMESGVRRMLPALQQAAEQGARIRIVCGSYLHITQPAALSLLHARLNGAAELYFYNDPTRSFHPKAYLIQFADHRELFIGSSNLSKSALTSGIEWNYRLQECSDAAAIDAFAAEFEALIADHADRLDSQRIQWYSSTWKRPRLYLDLENQMPPPPSKKPESTGPAKGEPQPKPVPRGPQIEALLALAQTRAEGARRALVQAATGVGKTYLAAFDSVGFDRVLFVAHRQEILLQAARTFACVRPEDSIGFFDAGRKDTQSTLLFASIQTIGRPVHLQRHFRPDDFDYVVVDEFHHAAADSYQRLIAYLKPKFLLGLTATPERTDDRSIYEICDFNVPFRMDLARAIDQGVLSPFHYYGIYDATDYSDIEYKQGHYNTNALFQAYQKSPKRMELIFKHYAKHPSRRALGFCASREHAIHMAERFAARGIPSAVLISSPGRHPLCLPREEALEKLACASLQVLFCVDMLNEGVDIPAIDLVMFLRPTESSIVFLQQLGRGLRKAPGKQFLTVLDFIGNYKNAGKVPALLSGAAAVSSTPAPGMYPEAHLPLPEGCMADFDLQLLDLFEQMRGQKERVSQNQRLRIDLEYQRIQELLQKVPSRMDLFLYMDEDVYASCIQTPNESPFRNYLAYRQRHQDLSAENAGLLNSPAGTFLYMLETTKMTRVYKMPVLMAFEQNGTIASHVSRQDLLESWKDFFASNTNWRDLPKVQSFQDYQAIPDARHLKTILNNPVHYLIQSGQGFFIQEDDCSLALHPDLTPFLEQPAFVEEYRDIVRFRQMDYYRRRFQTKQDDPDLQA